MKCELFVAGKGVPEPNKSHFIVHQSQSSLTPNSGKMETTGLASISLEVHSHAGLERPRGNRALDPNQSEGVRVIQRQVRAASCSRTESRRTGSRVVQYVCAIEADLNPAAFIDPERLGD